MTDAEIPAWYRRYVLAPGRFVGYVLGFALATAPMLGAAVEATAWDPTFGAQSRWLVATAVGLAVALYALAPDVPGGRVFQFGVVTQVAFLGLRALLVETGGFARGSPYLLADLALVAVAATALGHALTVGGLGAALKAAAESPWRSDPDRSDGRERRDG